MNRWVGDFPWKFRPTKKSARKPGTVPVRTYDANPFGLYEINGNVAQWMQDCHHDSYEGAPTDGSAWLTGPCETRDVRGGGWSLVKYTLRTAQRIGDPPQQRNSHLGFRVVRELRH